MQIIKSTILSLFLLPLSFAEVWNPGVTTITPDGMAIIGIPFPNPKVLAQDGQEARRSGFFTFLDRDDFDFKRFFAISENEFDPNLIEFSPGLFLPSSNKSGYILVENSKERPKLPTLGMEGVQPGFLSRRFFPNLSDLSKLKNLEKIPVSRSDFTGWMAGDSIAFKKSSELKLNIGFGAKTYFDYGVVGSISTTWDVQISRIPSPDLLVKVIYKRAKDSPFWFNKGNFGDEVNLYKLWGKSHAVTYYFDLENKNIAPPIKIVSYGKDGTNESKTERASALTAYQEAINGNLVLANLLSQLKVYGVRKIFEEENETTISNQTIPKNLKIPVKLDTNLRKDIPIIISKFKEFPGNILLENLVGLYSTEKKTREDDSFFSSRKFFTFYFQQLTRLDEDSRRFDRRFGANLKIMYTFGEFEREKLNREIDHSVLMPSFSKRSIFSNLPEEVIKKVELTIDYQISNYALDMLLNLPDDYPENVLVNEANELIGLHFKSFVDLNQEICKEYEAKNINQCIFISRKKTYKAMTDAYRFLKLAKMQKNFGNYLEFVKTLSRFGMAFVENRFVLGTIFKFLGFTYNPSLPPSQRFSIHKMLRMDNKNIPVPYLVRITLKGENLPPTTRILKSGD